MIERLDKIMATFSEVMWSMPLVITLIVCGVFFTLYSRFIPFRFLRHAVDILRGKMNSKNPFISCIYFVRRVLHVAK